MKNVTHIQFLLSGHDEINIPLDQLIAFDVFDIQEHIQLYVGQLERYIEARHINMAIKPDVHGLSVFTDPFTDCIEKINFLKQNEVVSWINLLNDQYEVLVSHYKTKLHISITRQSVTIENDVTV